MADPECARGGGVSHILAEKRVLASLYFKKMHENAIFLPIRGGAYAGYALCWIRHCACRRLTFRPIYVRSEMHYAFLARFRRLQTVPVLKYLIRNKHIQCVTSPVFSSLRDEVYPVCSGPLVLN